MPQPAGAAAVRAWRPAFASYRTALAAEPLPSACVDLGAFDQNLDDMLAIAAAHDKRIRLASKSIRCRALLERALARGGNRVCGVMSYAVREAAFLVERGVTRDVLVAYPSARADDAALLRALNARPDTRVALVVDAPEQLAALAAAPGEAVIPVVLELDMAWRPAGLAHIGVRRSPLHGLEAFLAFARRAAEQPRLRVIGVMGYEAQVAGLPDRSPFSRVLNPFKTVIRRRSATLAVQRRQAVVEGLRAAGIALELFNGGGTGSLAWTAGEPAITEVAAGSGLLCGHLFDYYSNTRFRPAAFFALQVVRHPAPGFATCHGGGYVASGEAGLDRLPRVVDPPGLRLTTMEAAGEVQTPLRAARDAVPPIGSTVFFRHAKSGELAEHFNHYALLDGDRIVARAPTYRGEGLAVL